MSICRDLKKNWGENWESKFMTIKSDTGQHRHHSNKFQIDYLFTCNKASQMNIAIVRVDV